MHLDSNIHCAAAQQGAQLFGGQARDTERFAQALRRKHLTCGVAVPVKVDGGALGKVFQGKLKEALGIGLCGITADGDFFDRGSTDYTKLKMGGLAPSQGGPSEKPKEKETT